MIAFVFPGQGAQYVGMGVEIATRFPQAAAIFARASAVLGFDLLELCRYGPEERLRATENTQPAILVASLACAAALAARGVEPSVAAGLSLGEYSALVAADAMSFDDAVTVVRRRGVFMQEATAGRDTAMAAIIGLDSAAIAALCSEHRHLGVVEPANFNGAGQVVIGGDAQAVRAAADAAKRAGARRAVMLAVSAPFHTSLMAPAAERLAEVLDAVEIRDAHLPVVANASAEPARRAGEIRSLLVRQVSSPVLWDSSMRKIEAMGAQTFVEVGPGTTLSGLLRKTVKGTVAHVEDVKSLEEALDAVKPVRAQA
jgi:[acyl-carrier-protein] S-malonyltransferase